jgi:hypothetical protein
MSRTGGQNHHSQESPVVIPGDPANFWHWLERQGWQLKTPILARGRINQFSKAWARSLFLW